MRRLVVLLIPAFIYADGLKSLLDFAAVNNKLVISSTLSEKAKEKELESVKSAYYPTLDAGAFYQRTDERSYMQPGDVYSGYAKVGLDIYDGGRKSSLSDQKRSELKASGFDTNAMKKSLSLEIVRDFFSVKNLTATLFSREEAELSLQEQLNRVKKFYEAQVATKEDVDRLQAAYDTNTYEIESLKFQILSAKKSLELKVGKKVETLDESNFKELVQDEYELMDNTKALMEKEGAILSGAESVNSIYYPQLRLEDTYNVYGYNRTDATHPEGLDNQNTIILSANIRLFDNGTVSENKQALIINSQVLNHQISYQKQEQKIQHDLALSRIQASKIKIKSAKSALISANSAFKTINEKYNAGIVDYVVFLDVLTSRANSSALYETSLNDLEVAYATYYYYSGQNIEEFLK